ncbi:hypothetical protein HHL16_21050 [Pseudoflavitalea sp. G-6-1-2]|uniref:hypothetical protein n=1 Tax=Pseudoflavitalea sp. G-6-1-2 TaxID=2728841 RepID=UPI00146BF8D5|nr:hypothetical protein [Pseudoflavitalea sp. G-6-1-2]NML23381.1 hypothetical protein [Pseudoflavitalea sp. G-6-1-2]
MKKTLLITAVLMFSIITLNAQQSPKEKESTEKSKLEAFSLKTGSLIKKEFKTLGTVKKVEIKTLILTDVLSDSKISGIKLETSVYKSYGSTTKSCFLDSDEIEAFLKSANYLMSSIGSPGELYSEFQFTSRDGFQAGCYKEKDIWKYFIKLEKYDGDSYVFLDKDDFQKLIDTIQSKG